MSYPKNTCGVRGMDSESNESVYNNFDVSSRGKGMVCGTNERDKCSTLKWFGNIESEITKLHVQWCTHNTYLFDTL